MFANDDRFEDERLKLRLSDVKRDEFELLGVIRKLPRLLDGRGTSYDESSILKNKLVAVLELDRIDWRLNACLNRWCSLTTGTAGLGMS